MCVAFEGVEFCLEVPDVAFFAFTEGALATSGVSNFSTRNKIAGTYAALFCAFRLLCAGVRFASFSSLLLLVLLTPPSSISPPSPESTLPTVGSGVCMAKSGEP